MEYVLMRAAHTAQVAGLEKQCFSMPWSENAIISELSNPISLWIVAAEQDRIFGYIGCQYGFGEADMMNLAVDPNFRGKGIGEGLVLALIEMLKGVSVNSLTLDVRQSNDPAVCLYKKLGFEQVGVRPNYYQKPKEAALILRKEW